MSKRELENINGAGGNEGLRHSKRRREVGGSSSDVDVTKSDPIEPVKVNDNADDPEKVKEQGWLLWTTVRDAVNKDGVSLSTPFLRKPPKRQYPDYYELIKQPIALDDIKKKLDHHEYYSLLAARNDFELLFANAKQYNQTESAIFQDAKELWKLVQKTYSRMVPADEDGEKKPPSLNRLMKSRLERLIAKKDTTGRVLSTEFMALPSKKEWPLYYKEIKKPQCLEAIYKHIKRKEYYSSAQFADDVELVFTNAMTFNLDNTPIWNDAMTLREYFRQLMSDMPHPHNLSHYASYAATRPSNKIKIKPPQLTQGAASNSAQQAPKQEQAPSASLFLRVPAPHPPSSSKAAPQPSLPTSQAQPPRPPSPAKPAPPPVETTAPTPKAAKPQPRPAPQPQAQIQSAQTKTPTPQPPIQTVSFINATPSHYPRAPYAPPPPNPTPNPVFTSATPPMVQTNSGIASVTTSQSPAPVILPLNHQLKSINLRIQPKGRDLTLDHRDGVKSWAVRLVPGESSIIVNNILFQGDEGEEVSSAEEDDLEKDEDYDMDVDVDSNSGSPSKNTRQKGKSRGRGRPPKAATVAAKAAALKSAKINNKKPATKVGEIQLKLNNFIVKEQPDVPGEWNIHLPVGVSTIEVGEVGGIVWKIYTERFTEV